MSKSEVVQVSELSDSEIDAVSGGGFNFNYNSATITQVNAVGFGFKVEQSNQAVNVQANQSDVWASIRLRNRQ
jgi:hypothetical protein